MRKKTFIQIFLIFLILLIFFVVYQNYFKKEKVNGDISNINKENIEKKNNLKNITYESVDASGRKYIINAESGTVDEKKPDLIFMSNANGRVILLDGSVIYISSLKAEYNTISYDTKFQENIKLKFLEHDIFCNNLNIYFKNNLLEAYNDLTYKNFDIIMFADKIEIDLLTRNTKISNFNENKVKIKKRYLNGNN